MMVDCHSALTSLTAESGGALRSLGPGAQVGCVRAYGQMTTEPGVRPPSTLPNPAALAMLGVCACTHRNTP